LLVLAVRMVTSGISSEEFSAWPRRLWLRCGLHRSDRGAVASLGL